MGIIGNHTNNSNKATASVIKNNFTATAAPTSSNDSSQGYSASSQWVYDGATYICTDATAGNAKWASSTDIFYFDTWALMVAAISATGTTYQSKYCVVANANGGVQSGVTYSSSSSITNPISDGGAATYYVTTQGTPYTVVCLTRTVTNPSITTIYTTASAKPTVAGYYIFAVAPTDGLPSGVSLNDIAYYNGTTWSLFCKYALAQNTIIINGNTYVKQNNTWVALSSAVISNLADLINIIYPVKSILMSTNPNNPSTYLAGTWTPYAQGRTVVGIDTTQTEFNTLSKTGGEKAHTLSTAEMPSHNHGASLAGRQTTASTGSSLTVVDPGTAGNWYGGTSISISSNGGGGSHNNLQPYIVCYMWQRIA